MQVVNQTGEKELISIIVPVYNVEPYLAKCLDSILAQTYLSFEVILINDGSTDESQSICEKYANRDNRFILVNQKNGGVSSARNHGLSIAKGKYITFVDSDDTIDAKYLETLYINIKKANADISMCSWLCNEKWQKKESRKIEVWDTKQTLLSMFKSGKVDGSVCSKLYCTECIQNLRFNEGLRIGEDQIFAIEAIESVNTVVFQDIPLYTYYIRNTSAMNSRLDSRYWDVIYRAEWFRDKANGNVPELSGLFRKEELNIYVTMIIRDMKGRTEESKEIVDYILPRIRKAKCNEFIGYSTLYQFVRFFMIKYFYPVACTVVKIKNR